MLDLPTDAEALRALVLTMMAERDAAVAEHDELATQNDRLCHLLLKLRRLQFGRKSERLPEEQLQLGLADLETAIAKADAEAERHDPGLRRDRAPDAVKRQQSLRDNATRRFTDLIQYQHDP